MISTERASQEEHSGANFSCVALSLSLPMYVDDIYITVVTRNFVCTKIISPYITLQQKYRIGYATVASN